jgi:hypothetical protein
MKIKMEYPMTNNSPTEMTARVVGLETPEIQKEEGVQQVEIARYSD